VGTRYARLIASSAASLPGLLATYLAALDPRLT
jgi:hypothetical protein